jgi:hypothetical protein
MSKFIRKQDGTLDLVEDDDEFEVVRDGKTFRVPFTRAFMDGLNENQRNALIEAHVREHGVGSGTHDGMGGPAGSRPGYVFSGDAEPPQDGADAVEAARQEMIDDVSNAWRGKPREKKDDDNKQPSSLADAERMREEAYQAYVNDMRSAWQR